MHIHPCRSRFRLLALLAVKPKREGCQPGRQENKVSQDAVGAGHAGNQCGCLGRSVHRREGRRATAELDDAVGHEDVDVLGNVLVERVDADRPDAASAGDIGIAGSRPPAPSVRVLSAASPTTAWTGSSGSDFSSCRPAGGRP